MKILAFSGSLRVGSFNRMALAIAVESAKKAGASVDGLDLKAYPMPGFDQDIQDEGMPEIIEKFKAKINEVDGLLIASPEYNHGVPGVLKNVIDWASRKSPELGDVFKDKTVGLMTASNGSFGGVRAQLAWLPTFKTLGLIVYPPQLPIPKAQDVFDENGNIVDQKMKERLEKFAQGFVEFTQKHAI
jgi:NAD(P)H-dependent FMN reductase